MTVSAHTHNAPLDPPCTREQDEREAREMAEAIAKLCTFQTFVDDADASASQEDHDHMMGVLLSGDVLEAHRMRVCIWRAHAMTLIEREAKGLRYPLSAAYVVVRRFQANEASRFPNRSAGTAPYGAALTGSEPEGRPFPLPRTGASADVPSPAAGFSSAMRTAA